MTVTGTLGNTNDVLSVNGVAAYYVDDSGDWEADGVPVSPTGTASVDAEVTDASSNSVASQVSYEPQPALAVIASYENVYRSISTYVDQYPGSCTPTVFTDATTHWISGNGSDYVYGSGWDGECSDPPFFRVAPTIFHPIRTTCR